MLNAELARQREAELRRAAERSAAQGRGAPVPARQRSRSRGSVRPAARVLARLARTLAGELGDGLSN